MKISRIRIYRPQRLNRTFNQSNYVVTVETDNGLIGIGEGGTPDTLTQCAKQLIGEDPRRTQHLWQLMYRGWFYPAGREKLHALGGLDLALWDIKGKALNTPVYDLLGGKTRDYMECYASGDHNAPTLADRVKSCMDAGFRAFRTAVGDHPMHTFHARQQVDATYEECKIIREAVGNGDWAIDFHTRLDIPDAVRMANLIEPLNPLFVEDPLRSENPAALKMFRQQTHVPIAVGEQFGDRWDVDELMEQHLIDYTRVTLPNVGGITEMVKIAAIAETHYIGMIPHFTGHISVAALVHVFASQPVPAIMELGNAHMLPAHLTTAADFHDGKLWPVDKPGLGVEFDPTQAELVGEITEKDAPIPMFYRPDGSITNW